MTTAAFMTELRKLGVELKVDGENLLCNAPKGVLTPNVQAELASRKAELITFLQTRATHPANDRRTAGTLEHDGNAPLSYAQERLWYLDQLQPGTTTYNLPSAIRIEGALDLDVLRRSLNEIVRRHAILRTRFAIEEEAPKQIVEPDLVLEMPLVDLSHLPGATRERELDEYLRSQAGRPFDLSEAPLLRAACVRSDEVSHVLFLMAHHSVFDGTSFGLLLRELAELYDAYLRGAPSPLPELPAQYADYTLWQRNQLDESERQRLLGYWNERLGGELPTLEMPIDRPRPPANRYIGSSESITIDAELVDKLVGVGRDGGATLFMVLLSAFSVLLRHYTGQEDFLVGSPVNARNRLEYEKSIGFFVNTLVLRTDVSGNPSFREVLGRVRESCLGAYGHQEMPFEELVRVFESNRDQSRTPLFQAMFAFQDASSRCLEKGGLSWKTMRIDGGVARTDLSFFLSRSGDQVDGVLEYNTDLFNADTIGRLLRHYLNLLEAIPGRQDEVAMDLPILGQSEREEILVGMNATQTPYPDSSRLHELFETQAASTPAAEAIVFEGDSVTYAELDRRANSVARKLMEEGVSRGALVGVCLERSTDMVAALLGVMKAGAAYVPLDPAFPADRLAYMMSDAGTETLLTSTALRSQLPETLANVVCIDTIADEVTETDSTLVDGEPGDIAYVIYTSGSTGKPKGVEVPHRGVVNFLESMRREPGLDANDRLLAVTTLSFDISVLELFLPLTTGATVILAGRETAADGRRLLQTISKSRVTVMQATPATWRLLLDAGWDESCPIKVLCGGESMPADLAAELVSRASSVWNLYGPTETTVWSTCFEVTDADVPILVGKPIANTDIFVLDDELRPLPVGVPGEVFIGGAGVTRGYLNRPELTAERFVPDTIGDSGARLYRTGDRARWRADGQLEHLGRIDNQVKVRGYRIELGEIETVLAEIPAVDQVAVSVWSPAVDDQRLVAYIVRSEGAHLDSVATRKHLGKMLPSYMLPQHYVTLDALPLTPNGKVDRKNLPEPSGSAGGDRREPPATDAEMLLAGIWSGLLGTDDVGRHDNFFNLGGHSLLAVKAVLETEKATGMRIELRQILLEDLAQIARRLDAVESVDNGSDTKTSTNFLRKLVGWRRRE